MEGEQKWKRGKEGREVCDWGERSERDGGKERVEEEIVRGKGDGRKEGESKMG